VGRKLALVGLLAAIVTVGVLVAMPAVASADPAIVIHNDGLCGMPGSDANGNITFGGTGIVRQVVENDNKVTLICKGRDLVNLSGRGQSYSGFVCGIAVPSGGAVITTQTHASVAANGNGTLTCTYMKT
jgi:hypothetical protein